MTIVADETWVTVEAGEIEAEGSTRDDEETVEADGLVDKEGAADADAAPVEDGIEEETVKDTGARLVADDVEAREEVAGGSAMVGMVELLEDWTWLLDIVDTINSEKGV